MQYIYLVIAIALAQFAFFTGRAGFSRAKFNISAPKTVGDEGWERLYRVQQNTMEQLVMFIPSMIIFTQFWNPVWALIPGVTFIIGRQLYSYQYIRKPESRATGMILSFFSNIALIIAIIVGFVISKFI